MRIGEGDFYEGFGIRFGPNIKTARDPELMGERLVDDDKLNFAPRVGWAWTPSDKWSIRAGAGVFYMQDTGNPRFDMARNAVGRRQDTADNTVARARLGRPRSGDRARIACGVQPPLVCIPLHYVLGNMYDRKTPYMVQYLFNVQRELSRNTALEIGYLGSRRASGSSGCSIAMKWSLAPSARRQDRRPYPEFTRIQEIGNVAEAKYNSLAVKLTRRLDKGLSILGGYTFSKSTDNGSGIRTLNGDQLFPQNSECFECEWGLSIFDVRHRFVSSILYELPFGEGKPFAQDGRRRGDSRWLAGEQHHQRCRAASREILLRVRTAPTLAATSARTSFPARIPNDGPKTIDKWFNTDAFALQPLGTYGNSPRNNFHRTRDLQFRHVDHPELQTRRQQEPAVQARSVQRVQPAGLERPEHVDGESRRRSAPSPARESRCASCSSA